MELFYTAIGNLSVHKYFVNQPAYFSFQSEKYYLAWDPLIQLPGIYAREMKHMYFTNTYAIECSKQLYL